MKFKSVVLAVMAVSMALPLTSSADQYFLKVTGKKQGAMVGGVTQKGREGQIAVQNFRYEVTSPRDPQSGLPTGKRMHKPFTIVMEWDRSSPLLFNALVNNENLPTVELHVWGPQMKAAMGMGSEVEISTFKLTNANLASWRILTEAPNTAAGVPSAKSNVLVEVSFTFQKIEMTHLNGGVMGMDDWESRV